MLQVCSITAYANARLVQHTNYLLVGSTPADRLYPLLGCGIGSISFYPELPHCIGCSGNCICLWLRNKTITCKPVREEGNSTSCWVFHETISELTPVSTICQVRFLLY